MFQFVEYYDELYCRNHPTALIVFGDNLQGYGKKGQASIRDLSNAYGVPTKRSPSTCEAAYFSDKVEEFQAVKEKLVYLWHQHEKGRKIILPLNQIGSGLSKIEEKSPLLHKFISRFYSEAKKVQYDTEYKNFLNNGLSEKVKTDFSLNKYVELVCLKEKYEKWNVLNNEDSTLLFELKEGVDYLYWSASEESHVNYQQAKELCVSNSLSPDILKNEVIDLFSMSAEEIQDNFLSENPELEKNYEKNLKLLDKAVNIDVNTKSMTLKQ